MPIEPTEAMHARSEALLAVISTPGGPGGEVPDPAVLLRIVEQAPVGVAVLRGPAHRHVFANAAYRAIPGLTEPVTGCTIAEVFPGLTAEDLALLEKVHVTRTAVCLLAHQAPTGGIGPPTWWNIQYHPLADGVLIITQDVTRELQTARETAALRDSERRLRLALDASGTGEWSIRPASGRFTASALTRRLHGLPLEGALDLATLLHAVHPDDRTTVAGALAVAGQDDPDTDGRFFEIGYRVNLPSGPCRWMTARGRWLPDPIGTDGTLTGVVWDATARLQAQQQVALAEKDALIAKNDLLLREVNHRVKNSLQMVASLLKLQIKRQDEARVRHAFEDAVARMGAIAQVHEQLHNGQDPRRIEFGAYLRGLCEQFTRIAGGTLCDIRTDCIEIPTDIAVPLGLLATELVTNALKYAQAGREPEVRLRRRRNGDMMLSVRDFGPGLPNDAKGGGGLGMRLIESLSRQIGATTRAHRARPGTCWNILLPLP
ncbi:Histidine kinase [Rhodovastum atsumiense]|uniref:histidine kinase n=1 Tax=Rhodovastum atsumiense TaxID=504468 RepID=A0A5M6IN75_9PROT|nr:histidine kinase dimerization/phosphoacceptor domain -containing protein [Rhodovastum atsumiense]KAA5609711.1 hypothetical protein F1189_22730 [Rhodovastum atsumiense]CAH2604480.1 Histidine kinase [Rhodovastum atsumiense]